MLKKRKQINRQKRRENNNKDSDRRSRKSNVKETIESQGILRPENIQDRKKQI